MLLYLMLCLTLRKKITMHIMSEVIINSFLKCLRQEGTLAGRLRCTGLTHAQSNSGIYGYTEIVPLMWGALYRFFICLLIQNRHCPPSTCHLHWATEDPFMSLCWNTGIATLFTVTAQTCSVFFLFFLKAPEREQNKIII